MITEIIISVVMSVLTVSTGALFFLMGKKKGEKDLLALFMINGYEVRTRIFRGLNNHVKKGGIVFVGDSITQDYPIGEYFPEKLVYNRGIGGDTSQGLLGRLEESVYALDPMCVILLIGTNDLVLLGDGIEAIFNRIQEAILQIRDHCPYTRIVCEAVYPVNPDIDPVTVSKRSNSDILVLNKRLKDIPDVTFIDLTNVLSDSTGALSKQLSLDGLHINQEGYRLVSDKLREIVPELN